MKPVIKQKIALFSPVGFLDGENAVDYLRWRKNNDHLLT